eukprot:TRINITY_DN111263_c0_g1_i1.p1 TRINITY_DN111263_c0_g1~~TRINITY_DN111263_c0_g1_i1.p1  ORF type:complete len:354 (+),score=41.29 TRINITY_DN111263_c0_g1_i1:87-1148(+)
MGNGVSSGNRAQLAGTFLAEQTHNQPPKYTLVSVSSALGPDGSPRHLPTHSSAAASSGSNAGRIRSSGAAGGAPVMTKLPALEDLEPLLTAEEPRQGAASKASKPAPSLQARNGQRGRLTGSQSARSPRAGRQGSPDAPVATVAEVLSRVATGGHTPWVATRTDAELYNYLAQRGKDSSLAKIASSADKPEPLTPKAPSPSTSGWQTSSTQSQSRRPRKHETYGDLFDNCVRQGQSRPPSSLMMWDTLRAASASSSSSPGRSRPMSREAPKTCAETSTISTMTPGPSTFTSPSILQSSRLSDLVEDILVLPEDPVAAFLSSEMGKVEVATATKTAEAKPGDEAGRPKGAHRKG